jgi:hypothetical protein
MTSTRNRTVPNHLTSIASTKVVCGGFAACANGYSMIRLPYATAVAMSGSQRLLMIDRSSA